MGGVPRRMRNRRFAPVPAVREMGMRCGGSVMSPVFGGRRGARDPGDDDPGAGVVPGFAGHVADPGVMEAPGGEHDVVVVLRIMRADDPVAFRGIAVPRIRVAGKPPSGRAG